MKLQIRNNYSSVLNDFGEYHPYIHGRIHTCIVACQLLTLFCVSYFAGEELSKYLNLHDIFKPVREKTNKLGSDQVQHKPGCTVTEDG